MKQLSFIRLISCIFLLPESPKMARGASNQIHRTPYCGAEPVLRRIGGMASALSSIYY